MELTPALILESSNEVIAPTVCCGQFVYARLDGRIGGWGIGP